MTIGIVGTGNVAWVLGQMILSAGHEILFVFGRDKKSTTELAFLLHATPIFTIGRLDKTPDIILLAVSDDSISQLSEKLAGCCRDTVIAHLSGSAGIQHISQHHDHAGVIYPLQTMRKGQISGLEDIPFYINATDEFSYARLKSLAQSLSDQVYTMDDEQRRKLHLSAVFANNFINHLLICIYEYMQIEELDFRQLKPLLNETISKFFTDKPELTQTGPAKRGDYKIIEKHLEMLKTKDDLRQLYQLFTKLIFEKNNPGDKISDL